MLRSTLARIARLLPVALYWFCAAAQGQSGAAVIQGVDVQKLANGILGIMSYTVAPDVTTSSLTINSNATSRTDMTMTQFGGGFTWSKETPLYLEGNAAWARYDPVFLVSAGGDARKVPAKWNSFSATGGIGWDIALAPHWVFRPIVNLTLGTVVSDLRAAKWWVDSKTNADLDVLDGGKLNAYGLGGALMLDYERFGPDADDDIEMRYTNVDLRSHGNSALGVQGRARAESASLWARRRVPTGWGVAFGGPVRYVYEVATTRFLGNETDVGLTQMSSVGFGLELDSSAHNGFVTRWRAVARYKFGPDLRGWSLGLALSF
jgi:hypothetical protein